MTETDRDTLSSIARGGLLDNGPRQRGLLPGPGSSCFSQTGFLDCPPTLDAVGNDGWGWGLQGEVFFHKNPNRTHRLEGGYNMNDLDAKENLLAAGSTSETLVQSGPDLTTTLGQDFSIAADSQDIKDSSWFLFWKGHMHQGNTHIGYGASIFGAMRSWTSPAASPPARSARPPTAASAAAPAETSRASTSSSTTPRPRSSSRSASRSRSRSSRRSVA